MTDQQELFGELFSLADSVKKSGLQLSACADKLSDAGHKGESNAHYDSKHLSSNNSRLDQLQDHAADPNPDVIELATGDLYKEFPGLEGGEDSYEEDMDF
jgi:hypothetical protein